MQSNLKRGALAGFITGILFGGIFSLVAVRTPAGNRVFMMQLVSGMSASQSFVIGWAYHLFDCIVMGAIFGAIMGGRIHRYSEGFKYGSLYGLAWWVLGGLFLMPIFLGLSIFAPQTLEPIEPLAIQSLVSHIIFGLILGFVFVVFQGGVKKRVEKEKIREIHRIDRVG
jgi:hypothetical protein